MCARQKSPRSNMFGEKELSHNWQKRTALPVM
jgi:hypothetical protein